jgi:hypothetical protein
MSKYNKVNKDHYNQAGRLTPDEMARERQKQNAGVKAPAYERVERRARGSAREGDGPRQERITGRARESSGSRPRRSGREE